MSGNGSGKPFAPSNLQSQVDWFDKCLLGLVACLSAPAPEGGALDELPTSGEPIGIIQVGPGSAKSPARRTDIGIVLDKAHQDQGYGPEMIKYVLTWCFDSLGLNKVELGTFGFNVAAQKCYEKVGFVKEGVRRAESFVQGQWVDGIEYGMLRAEWEVLKVNWDEEERARVAEE